MKDEPGLRSEDPGILTRIARIATTSPNLDDRMIDGADLMPLWLNGAASPHDLLFYFPTIGPSPAAVRDERSKYRRETGQLWRSKPHLSDLRLDQEAHNLTKHFPAVGARLRAALDATDRKFKRRAR